MKIEFLQIFDTIYKKLFFYGKMIISVFRESLREVKKTFEFKNLIIEKMVDGWINDNCSSVGYEELRYFS